MNSQELEKLLAAMRDENRGVEAPRRVETALRGAFRTQATLPARTGWRRWALAAAVSVTVGAAAWKMVQPAPPPPRAISASIQRPAIVLAAQQPAPEPPIAVKRVKRAARPRIAAPKVEPPPLEVATEFLPLENAASLAPIESGHILRVQLPRSTMVRFGLPVNQDRMMEPVRADVVFAQDGIARAIRFVK